MPRLRICTWNMQKATTRSDAKWAYFERIAPDIALLQEVNTIAPSLSQEYDALTRRAISKTGNPQRFSTVVLVRGRIEREIKLESNWDWVTTELERFKGNLPCAAVALNTGEQFHVMSAYNPPWRIDPARFEGVDVTPIRLQHNPDIWVTDLMWAALRHQDLTIHDWIVAGDLNSSITFDYRAGPRGNQEVLDRMSDMGFVECLYHAQGQLTPTFKNPRDGKVIHQIDHLFVPMHMLSRLVTCYTGDPAIVFDWGLSDHLPIIAEFS